MRTILKIQLVILSFFLISCSHGYESLSSCINPEFTENEKIQCFEYWAEKDNFTAQQSLATHYSRTGNPSLAFYWQKRAVEIKDSATAQGNLAVYYFNGYGVERNINQAIYWSTKAANNGDADSGIILGLLYANGYYIKQDYQKAFRFFSSAEVIAPENERLQHMLSMLYLQGNGVDQDLTKGMDKLHESANLGDLTAKVTLFNFYLFGGYSQQPDQNKAKTLLDDIIKNNGHDDIVTGYDLQLLYNMRAANEKNDELLITISNSNKKLNPLTMLSLAEHYEGNGEHKQASVWYAKLANEPIYDSFSTAMILYYLEENLITTADLAKLNLDKTKLLEQYETNLKINRGHVFTLYNFYFQVQNLAELQSNSQLIWKRYYSFYCRNILAKSQQHECKNIIIKDEFSKKFSQFYTEKLPK